MQNDKNKCGLIILIASNLSASNPGTMSMICMARAERELRSKLLD